MIRLATYFANDDRVLIARVNGDNESDLLDRFKVTGYPSIKFFPLGDNPKPEEVGCGRDFESLRDFVSNKLGPKTDDSKKDDSCAIKRLDDTSFASVALDPMRFVMVNFGAPWCVHCKALEPIWEKLAAVFRTEPGVIIASVDCDVNKGVADRYGIQGFPTIKIFGRGDKVPQTYEGARNLESLVKFVNEQAKTQRTVSGDVSREYGLNAEMDESVKRFFKEPALRGQIINAADVKANESKSPTLLYYVQMMKKIREDGPDFIGPEIRRINTILESCNVNDERVDNYRVRRNILYRIVDIGKLNAGVGTFEL